MNLGSSLTAEQSPPGLPAPKHARTLHALVAVHILLLVLLLTRCDPNEAMRRAPSILIALALGLGVVRWGARRKRRLLEAEAAEAGWTAEEWADREREEGERAEVGRRKGVWAVGVANGVMLVVLGVMLWFR